MISLWSNCGVVSLDRWEGIELRDAARGPDDGDAPIAFKNWRREVSADSVNSRFSW
jgi:hypothetical protein